MLLFRSAAFLSLLLPACAQEPSDAPDKTPSDFVRFVKVGDGGHLDTAITTYRRGDVTLTLFGAVHIADAACYTALNDRFTQCDVLLYELVGPADYRPSKNREERGFSPISLLQQGLKNSMELAFQLDEIDYQAANFVHADMTPREFQAAMAERGESLLSIMWNMMMTGMQQQLEQAESGQAAAPVDFDLVKAFRSGEGRHTLRLAFAAQMEQVELLQAGGKGSTLLEGRNEKCLEVLERELAAGRQKLGIYYGAAHFPHMEQRLVADLGFRKVGHEWLVAWDCAKRPDAKYDRALIKLRQRCRDELGVLIAAAKKYRTGGDDRAVPGLTELAKVRDADGKGWDGPLQDPWGTDYVLRKRPVGLRWEAVSAGQDKTLGTADDLVAQEPRRGGLLGF
ncbi:MAG: hypothetical protein WAT39_24945 [Planctomycetota bacterium]